MKQLVSIIIPTFNRAHLIGETLESIMAQTFQNWECIVVDDESTDETSKLLMSYQKKDPRIKFVPRPNNFSKGANSCRNYGFQRSLGKFIIWFDSDDLMTADHLQKKMEPIEELNKDFIIAKTANFEKGNYLKPYSYIKKSYGFKASDFILLKIHWYTYDAVLKREIAEKITWNEEMKSWQDYNYFCKMLLITENGFYLDEVLTHRRLHSNSIQKKLLKNKKNFQIELLDNRLLTFYDIQEQLDEKTRTELVYGLMNHSFEISKFRIYSKNLRKVSNIVKQVFGCRANIYFYSSLFTGYLFKKGFSLLEKAKKRKK